ncbi:MAG: hypothetical protein ABIP85_16770, partial [Chthoniobacteraceae bacterium]
VSAGGTSYSGLRHRQQFLQTFLHRCRFDEHRFGRPPHLRGGVSSGFRFWVNRLFQKSSLFFAGTRAFDGQNTASIQRRFAYEDLCFSLLPNWGHPVLSVFLQKVIRRRFSGRRIAVSAGCFAFDRSAK